MELTISTEIVRNATIFVIAAIIIYFLVRKRKVAIQTSNVQNYPLSIDNQIRNYTLQLKKVEEFGRKNLENYKDYLARHKRYADTDKQLQKQHEFLTQIIDQKTKEKELLQQAH